MGSGFGSGGFRLGSKSLKSFKLVFFSWVPPGFRSGPSGPQTVKLVQASFFSWVPPWFHLALAELSGAEARSRTNTKPLCAAARIRHREAVTQKRQPWTETVVEFGARLRDICDHFNLTGTLGNN